MVSIGRQKFGTDLQLMFRILKGLLFLGFVSVMAVLFVCLKPYYFLMSLLVSLGSCLLDGAFFW